MNPISQAIQCCKVSWLYFNCFYFLIDPIFRGLYHRTKKHEGEIIVVNIFYIVLILKFLIVCTFAFLLSTEFLLFSIIGYSVNKSVETFKVALQLFFQMILKMFFKELLMLASKRWCACVHMYLCGGEVGMVKAS